MTRARKDYKVEVGDEVAFSHNNNDMTGKVVAVRDDRVVIEQPALLGKNTYIRSKVHVIVIQRVEDYDGKK